MSIPPSGRIIFKVIGGLAVVLASFWISLQIMDYWSLPPNASEIHILEATYGLNCRTFAVPAGQVNRVKPGNATSMALEICGKATGSCSLAIDVGRMGDPAPGCRKDFLLQWRCGDLEKARQLYVAEEANAKTAVATCP
jgi:hypothetical protein